MDNIIIEYWSLDRNMFFHHSSLDMSDEKEPVFVNHQHINFEIMQLIEGSVDYIIEGDTYRLSKGDIIIINKNEHHSIVINSDIYERRVIEINPMFIHNLPIRLREHLFDYFDTKQVGVDNKIPGNCSSNYKISILMDKIQDNLHDAKYGELYMLALLTEILIEVNVFYDNFSNIYLPGKKNELVSIMINYIMNNIDKHFSLEIMSKDLNMSQYYMSHLFKNTMRTSIKNYILTKKIMFADVLIQDGLSATAACERVGFNDYSNFYRNYRKIIGTAPKYSRN